MARDLNIGYRNMMHMTEKRPDFYSNKREPGSLRNE